MSRRNGRPYYDDGGWSITGCVQRGCLWILVLIVGLVVLAALTPALHAVASLR